MKLLWWLLAVTLGVAVLSPAGWAAAPPRALWLWNPEPQFASTAAATEFFEFCRAHRIGVVWAQIGTHAVRGGRALDRPDDWNRWLTAAHAAGLKVHALDGHATYALRENHAYVLSIVNAVAAFTRAAPAAARFDGVHFDNEPYLLHAWQEPARREALLKDFLDLNVRITETAHGAGMVSGIDIPFWWQSIDDETNEAIGAVTFRGVRKAASYHVLDIVDNLGIMDYRNVAGGRDGIVAHAQDLLTYASRTRARVYVGVETSRSEDAPYWFIAGVPRAAFRDAIFGRAPSHDALRRSDLRIVNDGAVVHLGLKTNQADAPAALAALARHFKLAASRPAAAEAAAAALRDDGEWGLIEPRPVPDGREAAYAGVAATRTMMPKLTFAGKTLEDMERELSAAEEQLLSHSSYEGIAVHHYESYRAVALSKR